MVMYRPVNPADSHMLVCKIEPCMYRVSWSTAPTCAQTQLCGGIAGNYLWIELSPWSEMKNVGYSQPVSPSVGESFRRQ